MIRKRQRMWLVVIGVLLLGSAAALVFLALGDSVSLFRTPSQLANEPPPPDRRLRLGGLVEEGSVAKEADGVTVAFRVTDTVNVVPVRYRGLLPDLFREGQGVVAEGRMGPGGVFVADEVLAKHDENYMPPEVAQALKDAGQWKGKE
ncbi:MAG: cytochrome c maturation protein CcmE [Alphaproteobacteria bacterium]